MLLSSPSGGKPPFPTWRFSDSADWTTLESRSIQQKLLKRKQLKVRKGACPRSLHRNYSLTRNNFTQLFYKQVHLFPLQTQRRQQAQHIGVTRSPGDYLLFQQRFMNR